MTPTNSNISFARGGWVSLYSLSGITVGTQVVVFNRGSVPIFLVSSSVSPTGSAIDKGVLVDVNCNFIVAQSTLNLYAYAEGGSNPIVSVQENYLQRFKQGAGYTTHAHAMGMPFDTAVALNLIPGYSRVTALGNNPLIDTSTTPEDVYPGTGLYPWPSRTVPVNVTVVSSSVNDTSAGTGCRTVSITGLDINFNIISEILTLNGTSSVTSVNQYIRINSISMITAGSSNVNAGNVDVLNGANLLQRLVAGRGSMRSSNYTVPAGFTLAVYSLLIGVNHATARTDATFATYFGSPSGPYRLPLEISTVDAPYRHDIDPPIILAEKTDFCIRCMYVGQNGTDVTGAWNAILYQNTALLAV